MKTFFLFVLVSALIAVAFYYWRERSKKGSSGDGASGSGDSGKPASRERTRVYDLGPGGMAEHGMYSYEVSRVLRYDYDGWPTKELELSSPEGDQLFLEVEDDDGIQLALWRRDRDLGLSLKNQINGPQWPGKVEREGKKYEKIEEGSGVLVEEEVASSSAGSTKTKRLDTAFDYAVYEGEGGELLCFEDYGGGADLSTGKSVDVSEFGEIIPAA